MLISLNWFEEIKKKCDVISVIDKSVETKINKPQILNVHCILVLIRRCSLHTLQFKGEKSSWGILL